MTDAPKPGWYDDPEYAGIQRYWDGERWTQRDKPIPRTPPPAWQRRLMLLLLVAVVAAVVIGLISAQTG